MRIAEFLLARIAEDEAPKWTLVPYECEPGCCAPAGWVGSQCRWCDAAPHYGGTVEAITGMAEDHAETIHQRSRVLAECEAKRRIVGWHQSLSERIDDVPALEPRHNELTQVLRALARPYADHPDYDPAWRP